MDRDAHPASHHDTVKDGHVRDPLKKITCLVQAGAEKLSRLLPNTVNIKITVLMLDPHSFCFLAPDPNKGTVPVPTTK